jgi:hypothetical protein
MSETTLPASAKRGVKKSQLKKLVDNYYKVMKKTDENGNVVDLDPKKDAQSVWFPKSVIDNLFAIHGCTDENSGEYGLRVYFAVHQTGILHHDEIPGHYDNQQTVILVPTKNQHGVKDRDLLRERDNILVGADGKGDGHDSDVDPNGDGVNHGKLCPPDSDCGCLI